MNRKPATPRPADVSVTFRLPQALVARADSLVRTMGPVPGGKLTRSNILRECLERGLSELEACHEEGEGDVLLIHDPDAPRAIAWDHAPAADAARIRAARAEHGDYLSPATVAILAELEALKLERAGVAGRLAALNERVARMEGVK